MPDETQQVVDNALAPKRVSGDQGSAEQHPIADQLLAIEKKQAQTASRSAGIFRRIKMEAPGSV
jgi:hypothetical protein